MSDDWDGVERRIADQRPSVVDQRLTAAIAEVRDLRDAATKLAVAVEVRSSQFQRLFLQVAGLIAVLLIILMAFSAWQEGRLGRRLDRGHDLITCLLLVPPEARTAQSLIECQR